MSIDRYFKKLTLGVCYYPEHWPEEFWSKDLQRMRENGVAVIRIAEFAWNKFEPEEGVFTYDCFDRFLALAEKAGMKVIFCTPTATPPAWASCDYPEILNADLSGVLYRHGHRRHYNYNSEKYLQLTEAIVEKISAHYGGHPSIIGWQIDNEINCEVNEFYSESDLAAFRRFLQGKYGTLEALNRAWGTVFWNQDYTRWEQVRLPGPTPNDSPNPHQMLDYYRFVSDSARRYIKLQSGILRRNIPEDRFITTNGIFGNLDNQTMAFESLDFISYDSYPNFAFGLAQDPLHAIDLNDRKWSRNLAEARAVAGNFGVMEQQSAANGWNTSLECPAPKPGQMTLWTFQSIAHGADFISYFRWRTCTVGTEIYWHGILNYDSRDTRFLRELRAIADRAEKLNDLAGSRYRASFAVLKDYDNVWDAQLDTWHQRVQKTSELGWFAAAQRAHAPMDLLYLNDRTSLADLSAYPLLVYPHATIMTKARAELLRRYVQNGGTLVLGCRTGYKDETGRCVMDPMPGLLASLAGVTVGDFTLTGPLDGTQTILWDGAALDAAVFNDVLEPAASAEVLGRYASNYYSGAPGLVRHVVGKGKVYTFGAAFTAETALRILQKLGFEEPYRDIVDLDESCELAIREKPGKRILFLLNYSASPAKATLRKIALDLFEGSQISGRIELDAYGVRVFEIDR